MEDITTVVVVIRCTDVLTMMVVFSRGVPFGTAVVSTSFCKKKGVKSLPGSEYSMVGAEVYDPLDSYFYAMLVP